MWTWLTRRVGPAATAGVAAAWLLVTGDRARGRHAAAWRALRQRDGDGLTCFQREAEARARAVLGRHGIAVPGREVARGVRARGTPALTVTLRTSRPGLTIALEAMEAVVIAGGHTRRAEEWDTPSPDQAFASLVAAIEWGVRATQPPAG